MKYDAIQRPRTFNHVFIDKTGKMCWYTAMKTLNIANGKVLVGGQDMEYWRSRLCRVLKNRGISQYKWTTVLDPQANLPRWKGLDMSHIKYEMILPNPKDSLL